MLSLSVVDLFVPQRRRRPDLFRPPPRLLLRPRLVLPIPLDGMQRPETRATDMRGRLPREGIVEEGEIDRFAFAELAARVAQRVVREAREVRREWVRSLEL